MWLSAEQSQQLADRRRRGDAEDLPPRRDRRASRGRDGPLPHRAHGFANTPALLGEVMPHRRRRRRAMRSRSPQGFVRNQGDAWTWTLDQLKRAPSTLTAEPRGRSRARGRRASSDYHAVRRAHRPAHSARCTPCWRAPTDDPAFAPRAGERATTSRPGSSGATAMARRRVRRARSPRAGLGRRSGRQRLAARCSPSARRWHATLRELAEAGDGDAHDAHPWRLPSRPGAGRQRRCLHHRLRGRAGAAARRAPRQGISPLRDVAGMLRSFDYAAATALDPQERRPPARMSPDRRARRCVTRLRERRGSRPSSTAIATAPASRQDADSGQRRCSTSSCSRRRPTSRLRGGQPAGLARRSRCAAWRASPTVMLAPNRMRVMTRTRPTRRLAVREAEALADGTPSAIPSRCWARTTAPAGRVVRAFLPGAQAVEVLRARRPAPLGTTRADGSRTGLFDGPVSERRALSAAHRLAGRGAGDRRSLFLRPAARRARSASVQRGPAFRAGRGSSAPTP